MAGGTESLSVTIKAALDASPKAIRDLNTQLGKLSGKLSALQIKISVDPKQLSGAIEKINKELEKLRQQTGAVSEEAGSASGALAKMGEAFKEAIFKFPAGAFFTGMAFFIREGVRYTNELNVMLTEISVLTGKSQAEVAELGRAYNQLAKELNVTTKQIAEAAVEFTRQGLSQSEVISRVQTATQFAKVANVDFKSSAELLTVAVDEMGVGMNRAADVFIRMGQASGIGADEIGRGYGKVAKSSSELGLQFEKVASWIAAVSSSTNEGAEAIGQSMDAVFSRIGSIRDIGYDKEDGTRLYDVAKAFGSVGIALEDAYGFRDFGQILDELGVKWGNLSHAQQIYVSKTIAGAGQQSQFMDMMDSYGQSIPLYQQSLQAAGTTQETYNLYLQGTQAHIDRLRASMEGLWGNVFESEAIRTVIDALGAFIDMVSKTIDTFGLAPVVITAAGALALFNTAIRTTIVSMAGGALTAGIGTAVSALSGLRSATLAARIEITALQATVSLGLSLAIAAVTAVIMKMTEAKQAEREESAKVLSQYTEKIAKTEGEIDALKKLSTEYETLTSKTNKSAEDLNRLHEIEKELVATHQLAATGIDSYGAAYTRNTAAVRERITQLEQQKKLEDEILKNKVLGNDTQRLKTTQDNYKSINNSVVEITRFQNSADQIKAQIENKNNNRPIEKVTLSNGMQTRDIEYMERLLEIYYGTIAHYQQKITEEQENITESNALLLQTLRNDIESNGSALSEQSKSVLSEYARALTLSGVEAQSAMSEISNKIAEFGGNDGFDQKVRQFHELRQKVAEDPDADSIEKLKEIGPYMQEMMNKLASQNLLSKEGKKAISEFSDQFVSYFQVTDVAASRTDILTAANHKMLNGYSALSKKTAPLIQMLQDVADGKQLNADAVLELALQEEGLLDAITIENGQLSINKEAVAALRDEKVDAFLKISKAQQAQIALQEQLLVKELEGYGLQIDGVTDLADAKAKLLQIDTLISSEAAIGGPDFPMILERLEKMKSEITDVAQAKEASNKLIQLAEGLKGGAPRKTKNEPRADTQAVLYKPADYTREEIHNINQISSSRDPVIKLLEQQVKAAEAAEDYNQSLDTTKKLLDERLKKLTDIDQANRDLSAMATTLRENHSEWAAEFAKENDQGEWIGFDAWFNADASEAEAYVEALKKIESDIVAVQRDGVNLTKQETDTIKALESKMSTYKAVFGQLQMIKQAWQQNEEAAQSYKDTAEQTAQSLVDTEFQLATASIQVRKQKGQLSIKEELAAWKEVARQFMDDETELQAIRNANAKKRKEAEKEIAAVAEQYRQNEFSHSERWISEETTRMTLAGKSEIEIAKMVLDARLRMADEQWTKERELTQLSESEQLAADKNVYEARKKYAELQRNMANEIIEVYKKAYEAQRDAELKSLQQSMDAEEERHRNKIKHIEQEYNAFEQAVNAQLKLLDRQSASEDFEKSLSGKQKETQQLRGQINQLALDDSIEAKAKREQLERELAAKLEEIEAFKQERTKTLMRNDLQDRLDAKKTEVDAAKEAEDNKYAEVKASLDQLKTIREEYWANMINNDAKWTEIQNSVIAGQFDQIEKDFEAFKTSTTQISSVIGQALSNDLIAKIEQARQAYASLKNMNGGQQPATSGTIPSHEKESEESQTIAQMKQNSEEWHKTSDAYMQYLLHEKNKEELAGKLGPNVTYQNGTWYRNNLPLFHQGGEAGAPGTSFSRWLNLKSDEIAAVLRKGELVLNNPVQNIAEMMRRFIPNISSRSLAVGPGNVVKTYHLNFNIEKITGDENGGRTVFQSVLNGLHKLGD
jgi:TP901 family phage tail tape measure protein